MDKEEQGNDQLSLITLSLNLSEINTLIIKSLPVGFSLVDGNGVIVEFNNQAERLTGYSREEVIGASHFEIIHNSEDPASCPLFSHVLTERTASVASETVLKKKNGGVVTLLVSAFPLFDPAGYFIGGAELFLDISEQKRLEMEHANLLSMFAHDMKSPVVAATGFLTRLISGKAGALTEKQVDYIDAALRAVTKLQGFISDFLEFSRLDKRQYSPILGPYDIEQAIREQIEMTRLTAEKKPVQVIFDYKQKDVPIICADGTMINRVLSNLVDNALKYTNSGGTVTIRLNNREEDVLVEVEDTGVGIGERDIPCVFEPFCRINHDIKGTGLGLSIARVIVEAHHGRISLESRLGKGSRFWFSIPKETNKIT